MHQGKEVPGKRAVHLWGRERVDGGGGARELTCRSGRPSPSRGPSPAFISWRHRPGGKHCGYARAMTKAQAYSGSQKREKKQA